MYGGCGGPSRERGSPFVVIGRQTLIVERVCIVKNKDGAYVVRRKRGEKLVVD
jgi:hypothetical protein